MAVADDERRVIARDAAGELEEHRIALGKTGIAPARVLLAHAPVAGDQLEAQLREIARFYLANATRYEVIVEQTHSAPPARF